MSKRVILVHGWADDPRQGWLAWLAKELQARGIETTAPHFTDPDPDKPHLARWIKQLDEAAGKVDTNMVLVGHSLGCYLVLEYLSRHEVSVAGIVLVAGGLPNWRPELLDTLDLELVKQRAKHRICIYSDNDHVVEPARTQEMAKAIHAEEIVDPGKRHFAGLRGVTELPSVLEVLDKLLVDRK